MINPLVQIQRIGVVLEDAHQRHPRLLPVIAGMIATLIAAIYGMLLATGAPYMIMLVLPIGIIGLWLVFNLPEYAALVLLGFRWGFIFDSLDRSIGLQSPSLPLAALLILVYASQVIGPQKRKLTFDPIIIVLLAFFLHVALGVWYANDPRLVTVRVNDFAKDIVYTIAIAYWLVQPRIFEGSMWLMAAVGGLLGSLTLYQEITQTYDNSYWDLARVKIAQIVEGIEDRPRASGSVGDPNFYGQQILTLLPIALWWIFHARNMSARLLAIYSTVMILVGVGLSYSRGAYLAVAMMAAFYFVRFKIELRFLLYVVPLVIVLAMVAPPELTARFSSLGQFAEAADTGQIEENSLANRLRHIMVGLNLFLDSPIIGHGAQHFKANYIIYILDLGLTPDRDANRNAHNLYLEILSEHGLIGLGLFLAMLIMAWQRFGVGSRTYKALGDQRMADLGGYLQMAMVGYGVAAFFLHGDYPRFHWLLLGVAVAYGASARETAQARAEAEPPASPVAHPQIDPALTQR